MTGLPTLSTAGVVRDPDTKYQRIIAWLFVSEKNQDDINYGEIKSFVDIKDRAKGDPFVMADIIESELGEHMRKHLPGASVSCKVTRVLNTNGYDIRITTTYDGGETMVASVNLNESGILSEVVAINNNGGGV